MAVLADCSRLATYLQYAEVSPEQLTQTLHIHTVIGRSDTLLRRSDIDRILDHYPHLTDDKFVAPRLEQWLR